MQGSVESGTIILFGLQSDQKIELRLHQTEKPVNFALATARSKARNLAQGVVRNGCVVGPQSYTFASEEVLKAGVINAIASLAVICRLLVEEWTPFLDNLVDPNRVNLGPFLKHVSRDRFAYRG